MKNQSSKVSHSLEIFQKLFEHHHDAMVVLDKDGVIVMCNHMALKILEQKKEKMLGKQFVSFIPKSARTLFARHWQEKTQYVQMEKEVLTIHKQMFTIDGCLMSVLTFHRLSYRNEIERDLLLAKTSHRTLIELVKDEIFITDRSMRLLYINEYAAQTFHQDRKKMIGKKITDLFPKNAKHIQASVRTVLKTGMAYMRESKLFFPDGVERWFRTHLIPIVEDENVTAILFIAHDVTNYKIAEETIHQLEEKYKMLVEKSSDGILVIQDGVIRFSNANMAKMLSLSPEACVGKLFLDFVAPSEKDAVAKHMNDALKKSICDVRCEIKIQVRGIVSHVIDGHGSVIPYEGKPAILLIARDVTQEQEIEKMKSDFVAITSHQMRTPLTGIKWFAELLKGENVGALNKDQMDYLDQIISSNQRMIHLINDLTNISQIEQGNGGVLKMRLEDPIPLLQTVLQEQVVFAKKKHQKIEYQTCPDGELRIRLDKIKMHEAFQNILHNAIKYSPNGSKIQMKCAIVKNEFIFSVTDHGVGIPEAQQNKVFQRFFRADNVISMQGGTGLGLYVAKQFVEMHKGRIWFESKEGKGTTFFVALPLKQK